MRKAGFLDRNAGLREALKGDDATAIKRSMENLEKSSHKVAEAMYRSTAQAGAAEQPPKDEKPKKKGPDGEDVIDAEYDVKE